MCNCNKENNKSRELELLELLASSMGGIVAIVEDKVNRSRYCKYIESINENDIIIKIITNE